MPTTSGSYVSIAALVKRLNRQLAKRAEQIRKPRTDEWWPDLGDYYIIDTDRNFIVAGHVDPERLGREMGVLRPWEVIGAGS